MDFFVMERKIAKPEKQMKQVIIRIKIAIIAIKNIAIKI